MAITVEAESSRRAFLDRFSRRSGLLSELLRRPTGLLGLSLVLLTLVVAVLAPVIAPHSPDTLNVAHRFQGPSAQHLLGTDDLGRDILSRVLFGTRIAIEIAVPAVVMAFTVGIFIGMTAGYAGGWLDKLLVVVLDTLLSFPALILALALLTLLGTSMLNTTLVIALAFAPYYGRLARAQALAVKQNTYVKAERALGAGRLRIISVHLLPNIIPPLVILMSMDVPGAIGTEAGLAFLGLGVQPPTPDWGVMMSDGFINLGVSPWALLAPLMAIVVVAASFTMLGETLRDIADPKLKGSLPRRGRLRSLRLR
jgi:peptide/nickel transport system permease protein